MNNSRTKNATRNAIAGILNRIVGLLVPFVLRTALIKVLGEEYLGLSNLFSSLLQVLNLADLGFGTAITYSMYKPIAEHDDAKICALLMLYRKIYFAIGLIILILGLCLIPFLDYLIEGGYPEGLNIVVLYLMYLFNTVCSYLFFAHRKSLMSAFQRSDIETTVNSIVQIILDVIKIALLFILKDYYIYVFFVPLTTLLSGLITAAISYQKYPQYRCRGHLDKSTTNEIIKRCGALAIQKFGNTISTSLDSIVISSFLGLTSVAIYGNYFYIVSSLIAFAWVCISATTAGLGNSMVSKTVDANYKIFSKLNMLNQWVITWCIPCLLCLYQHFMRLWVGESLMMPNEFVVLMVIYFYITESRKVVMVFKDAGGLWWADKWKPLVGCAVNLVFNIVSVQLIGMNGVIISTIISYLFIEMPWESYVLFNEYFRGYLKKYLIDLGIFFIVIIFASLACIFACSYIPGFGIFSFFIKGAVCFAISNIIFILMFKNRKEFKELCNMISSVIKLKI